MKGWNLGVGRITGPVTRPTPSRLTAFFFFLWKLEIGLPISRTQGGVQTLTFIQLQVLQAEEAMKTRATILMNLEDGEMLPSPAKPAQTSLAPMEISP
jgi:hypothetical protein